MSDNIREPSVTAAKRAVTVAVVGNVLEWYDFAVYGFLAAIIGKNLLGVVLIVAGLLLSLPGVPGQGVLTMLVGLLLLDIPGKRRFELALVRRKTVHRVINKLRARFDRAPLLVEPPAPEAPPDARAGADPEGE